MANVGQLRERLQFQARAFDANGDALGPWVVILQIAARVQLLKGSEPVLAERLQGVQPVQITVRYSVANNTITTACRAINLRTSAVYEPITAVAPDERRAWIDILASWKVGQPNG